MTLLFFMDKKEHFLLITFFLRQISITFSPFTFLKMGSTLY